MREIATIITALSFLLLTACSADKPAKTLRSAYYWSTTWQMDSSKSDFIHRHHIKRLYVRYFDVVRDEGGEIMPNATIRLHQLSQSPPPVDKGVLMMYNTGDAKQLKCQKPILDMKDVAPYIQHLASYPLPLSAAYPLFRWNILFREGKFVGILHKDDDYPILPSDSIVVRQPEMTDIMEAIKSINHQNKDINNEVILFDLNNYNIKRFSSEDYERIYQH